MKFVYSCAAMGEEDQRGQEWGRAAATTGRGCHAMAEQTDTQQDVLVETTIRRAQARAVLDRLLADHQHTENQLAQQNRADYVKSLTGRSSLESAIEQTRGMIETLDRVLEQRSQPGRTQPELVG